jgi:DNA polymerase-3 subunit epsilon
MHEQASLWDQPDLLGGGPTPVPSVDDLPAPTVEAAIAAEPEFPAAAEPAAAPPPPSVTLPTLPSPAGRPLPSVPERLLILDTETTALCPAEGQVIELGAVLFHVPSRAVLGQVSFLLPATSNPAEAINGIPAAVSQLPQPWQAGLVCFEAMLATADVLLAHNAAFDRQWFGHGALPLLAKPWICSMEDIRWPQERHLRATPSVRDLALAYGVPVWAAHRALTDCIYLAQVFERCPELEMLLQAALEPRQLYRACVSYAERQRAREAGFRWNDPVPGAWSRRLSQREVEDLPFTVQPVRESVGEGDGKGQSDIGPDAGRSRLDRLPRSA